MHFEGYRTAMVGWNPEQLLDVDVDAMATDCPEELADVGLAGLVLAEHLRSRPPLGPTWAPFRPGYVWFPHARQ